MTLFQTGTCKLLIPFFASALLWTAGVGCDGGNEGSASSSTGATGGAGGGAAGTGTTGTGGAGSTGSTGSTGSGGAGGTPPDAVAVHLIPRQGVSGLQRVNFAVPLMRGALGDEGAVRVLHAGVEIPTARRALAHHPDGTIRSVQIQVDLDIAGETDLEVRLGSPATAGDLTLTPVQATLDPADGTQGPRVWALLPAPYLSSSGVTGPQVPEADVAATPLAAWSDLCDYDTYDVEAFLQLSSNGAVWLYDRGTVMYRGYARRGDLVTLESAYRETAIYRAGLTGSGASLDISVPGKHGDMKYFYAQNMAIHYLLSGDDRFQDGAVQIAQKMGSMWNPHYSGGDAFWTERHAGFRLLADVWAAKASDAHAADLMAAADDAVDDYLDAQGTFPPGYGDPDARCFAHTADAHGEPYGYWGCSPWMSAIVADGLDAYASERGGAQADAARAAIVKLGRVIAEQGRDADGRPYYWMGVGNGQGEVDGDDEHWGEAAYLLGMAWYYSGKQDMALLQAAQELLGGFSTYGVAPHMRSFNWQCRSAVAAPYYLR